MRSVVTILSCLLVGASLAISESATAQTKKTLGIVGGFNSTDFRAESLDSTFKAKIKLLAGGSVGLMFTPSWGVRLEVLYAQKSNDVLETGLTWKGSYIQLPLLAELSVPFGKYTSARFLVSMGPTVAFNVSCTVEDATCKDVPGATRVLDGTDFTFMAALGFGAGPVIFDVRYDLGLVNINTVDGGPETKTRSFWITLSYYFPIGS